jgi:hypothetical protein
MRIGSLSKLEPEYPSGVIRWSVFDWSGKQTIRDDNRQGKTWMKPIQKKKKMRDDTQNERASRFKRNRVSTLEKSRCVGNKPNAEDNFP